MRVLGDGHLAVGGGGQHFAMTRRDGQPPLGIEYERRSALEHRCKPLLPFNALWTAPEGTIHHLIALFCTVAGKDGGASPVVPDFCNEINDLERTLRPIRVEKSF